MGLLERCGPGLELLSANDPFDEASSVAGTTGMYHTVSDHLLAFLHLSFSLSL